MPTGYFDRQGRRMTRDSWHAKRQEPSYTIVRQFDNERVKVVLRWDGAVPNVQNLYSQDYYPLFRLDVWNYNDVGRRVLDPMSGEPFGFEVKAIQAYEEFIAKYSDSVVDAAGQLIEVGNTLEVPLPPDPNRPVSKPEELGGEAW